MALTYRAEEPSTASIADIVPLFDHLVGALLQNKRHGETERFRSLKINRLLGRCLHRQIARLLALEDAIDVISRAPIGVGCVRSVGH
jgi:hypothetical protein